MQISLTCFIFTLHNDIYKWGEFIAKSPKWWFWWIGNYKVIPKGSNWWTNLHGTSSSHEVGNIWKTWSILWMNSKIGTLFTSWGRWQSSYDFFKTRLLPYLWTIVIIGMKAT
jgi:hypothetical protein